VKNVRTEKPPLNRRSRRRLARQIDASARLAKTTSTNQPCEKITLTKRAERPPGCTFLGSRPTEVNVSVGPMPSDILRMISDSGSDITLISEKALRRLSNSPKLRAGQKINLIQVTGSTTISGYVRLDLVFETEDGPVEMDVEAYVVRGMSNDFIFGNDYADQYDISLIRENGTCRLVLGNSGRSIPVETSMATSMVDENGKSFKVSVQQERLSRMTRVQAHRKRQVEKRHRRIRFRTGEVKSSERIVIPAGSCCRVPVNIHFDPTASNVYVEKVIHQDPMGEGFYGAPDSLISRDKPYLQVSNFSPYPIVVPLGQVLGKAHNPKSWLDRPDNASTAAAVSRSQHHNVVCNLVRQRLGNVPQKTNLSISESTISSKAQRNATEADDEAATEPVEGGPKVSETPQEAIASSALIESLDFSPDLSADQRQRLEEVVRLNEAAFALDG
jgi:hypothetical protein